MNEHFAPKRLSRSLNTPHCCRRAFVFAMHRDIKSTTPEVVHTDRHLRYAPHCSRGVLLCIVHIYPDSKGLDYTVQSAVDSSHFTIILKYFIILDVSISSHRYLVLLFRNSIFCTHLTLLLEYSPTAYALPQLAWCYGSAPGTSSTLHTSSYSSSVVLWCPPACYLRLALHPHSRTSSTQHASLSSEASSRSVHHPTIYLSTLAGPIAPTSFNSPPPTFLGLRTSQYI